MRSVLKVYWHKHGCCFGSRLPGKHACGTAVIHSILLFIYYSYFCACGEAGTHVWKQQHLLTLAALQIANIKCLCKSGMLPKHAFDSHKLLCYQSSPSCLRCLSAHLHLVQQAKGKSQTRRLPLEILIKISLMVQICRTSLQLPQASCTQRPLSNMYTNKLLRQ